MIHGLGVDVRRVLSQPTHRGRPQLPHTSVGRIKGDRALVKAGRCAGVELRATSRRAGTGSVRVG
eukprot:scaffold15305_cov116-Isochrysis_galbana.AAC.3